MTVLNSLERRSNTRVVVYEHCFRSLYEATPYFELWGTKGTGVRMAGAGAQLYLKKNRCDKIHSNSIPCPNASSIGLGGVARVRRSIPLPLFGQIDGRSVACCYVPVLPYAKEAGKTP